MTADDIDRSSNPRQTNEFTEAYQRIRKISEKAREPAPLCIDCAHHRLGRFGGHWCYGHVYRNPVTGEETVIPERCSSARHTHACGPEARLFTPKSE